jgi:hypothetical protein
MGDDEAGGPPRPRAGPEGRVVLEEKEEAKRRWSQIRRTGHVARSGSQLVAQ